MVRSVTDDDLEAMQVEGLSRLLPVFAKVGEMRLTLALHGRYLCSCQRPEYLGNIRRPLARLCLEAPGAMLPQQLGVAGELPCSDWRGF